GFIGSPPMNFLAARLQARDTVVLADGSALRLPDGAAPAGAETAVVVGFRPEDAQIGTASASGTLPFDLAWVGGRGAGRLLHGRLAGDECVVARPAGSVPAVQARLSLRIPPQAIHLFEPGSGARIDAGQESLAAEQAPRLQRAAPASVAQ